MTFGYFFLAAIFEIAGCYTFWLWWKLDKSLLWIAPGIASLMLFAWLLTQAEAQFAGRAYAAYGGIYIVSSLAWGVIVENQKLSLFDYGGASLCIAGACLLFFANSNSPA